MKEAVYRNKFKLGSDEVEITSYDPVNRLGTATICISSLRDGAWRCTVLTADDVRKIFWALPTPNPGGYAAVC